MSIKLMYITNSVEIAGIAQRAGVDRIWIDLECIGKEERQAGMDTVKSHHTIDDIKKIRPIIDKAELLVRVNPMHEHSHVEINRVIDEGADIIMLPMFKTRAEVQQFLDIVGKRVKTLLLIETKEAVENIHEILSLDGINEVHIGLNDLHLSYGREFMFELLAEGIVDEIVNSISKYNYPYGFGGIARIGYGQLPAEMVLREHYRLRSQMTILSRSFCKANTMSDFEEIEKVFFDGISNIRKEEEQIKNLSVEHFEANHRLVCEKVKEIIMQSKKEQ